MSSELRLGSARKDSDSLSTGSLLLSFMTQASGNVKTALEKPANFKRNINHRRYLQKQLRNFSKKKGDAPTKKSSSSKLKSTGKQSYSKSQGVSYMKSLRESWMNHAAEKERNTLKERNLPASFWQEPLMPPFSQEFANSMYQFQPRPDEYGFTAPNQDIESYLSGWNSAVAAYDMTTRPSGEFQPTEAVPSITSDSVLGEEFMTGEELTRNLDIKDLYVPEMYSADKLLSDVQETLLAGQISPSQYYLPSPSPYNTDQGYFSFEHDPQGLPPIAMAFLSQNSIAQC